MAKYSSEPRQDIVERAKPLQGKTRAELHAIRNAALAAKDYELYQAATYALAQLVVKGSK